MKYLIINVGGSSTKVAIYIDGELRKKETIRHDTKILTSFSNIWEQYGLRLAAVIKFCRETKTDLEDIDVFVSRGPMVRPIPSGTYKITESMLGDAESGRFGSHPCGLGCKIAHQLAGKSRIALTVDPPCVDEMINVAKYTGIPFIRRKSKFQALNHKAIARKFAHDKGMVYEELDLVVCHLGSGISIGSHHKGVVIDVTNGLDGDGPFGLDRPGTIPAGDWLELILSGALTEEELKKYFHGNGGAKAWLDTNNGMEIENRIRRGDKKAKEVYEAMAYQVAKGIGAASSVFGKKPDGIILTGGLAESDMFSESVIQNISWICEVRRMTGDDEIQALYDGAYKAMEGLTKMKIYEQECLWEK